MYPSTTSVSFTTLFTLLIVSTTTYAQQLPSQSISLIPEVTTTETGGAAFPTQTGSNCMLNCFTSVAASTGCNLNDNSCVCADTGLQISGMNCVQAQCSQQEFQQAQQALALACQSYADAPLSSLTIGNPIQNPNFTPTFGMTSPTANSASQLLVSRNSMVPAVAAVGVGMLGFVLGGTLLL